jgi:hypothetical protein
MSWVPRGGFVAAALENGGSGDRSMVFLEHGVSWAMTTVISLNHNNVCETPWRPSNSKALNGPAHSFMAVDTKESR